MANYLVIIDNIYCLSCARNLAHGNAEINTQIFPYLHIRKLNFYEDMLLAQNLTTIMWKIPYSEPGLSESYLIVELLQNLR